MKDFTPDQVRRMSLHEVNAAMRGFREFNTPSEDLPSSPASYPTKDEVREAFAELYRQRAERGEK